MLVTGQDEIAGGIIFKRKAGISDGLIPFHIVVVMVLAGYKPEEYQVARKDSNPYTVIMQCVIILVDLPIGENFGVCACRDGQFMVFSGRHIFAVLDGVGHPVPCLGLQEAGGAVLTLPDFGDNVNLAGKLRHPYLHSLQVGVTLKDVGCGCRCGEGVTGDDDLFVDVYPAHSPKIFFLIIITVKTSVFPRFFQ